MSFIIRRRCRREFLFCRYAYQQPMSAVKSKVTSTRSFMWWLYSERINWLTFNLHCPILWMQFARPTGESWFHLICVSWHVYGSTHSLQHVDVGVHGHQNKNFDNKQYQTNFIWCGFHFKNRTLLTAANITFLISCMCEVDKCNMADRRKIFHSQQAFHSPRQRQVMWPVNKKVRLLKESRVPEVVLTSDSDESKCDTDCGRGGRMWISSRWDIATKKSIQHKDPAQPVPLKKRIMKRADQTNRHDSQQSHGGHCPLALKTV
jgi:hypothetical protein